MSFRFIPAGLNGVGVFGAIAGGSRSGKTLTALRIARGIAGPKGRVVAIDTEGKRMSHYAQHPSKPEIIGEKYHFDVFNMQSPFHPLLFRDILADAEADGAACAVVDSFSLEWSGIGGVLDLYDQEFKRMGGKQANSDKCWAFAKRPHKLMRDSLLQSSMPVLFCIRSNEVPKHLANGVEGTWKAEQDKRFLYEWTFALTLHPNTPGQPRYDLKMPDGMDAWKMPKFFVPFFPPGEYITEAAGESIQRWRNSDGPHDNAPKRTVRDIVRDRCASASDEEDITAIETLEAVQVALAKAPEEIRTEIRTMIDGARARVAELQAAASSRVEENEPATETG